MAAAEADEGDDDKRERRLEQVVTLQRDVMRQQQRALQGMVLRQARLAAQEIRVEQQLHRFRGGVAIPSSIAATPVGAALASGTSDPAGGASFDADSFSAGLKNTQVMKASWREKLLGGLAYIFLMLLVAYCYGVFFQYDYGTLKRFPTHEGDDFAFGVCDGITRYVCDPDWRICCCACCCIAIRWADTAASSKVNFMSFFGAVLVFTILEVLTGLSFFGFLLLLALAVLCRQTIRAKYGLPHNTCDSICQDCCVWCLCSPCAAMQEALQVEFVDLPQEAERKQRMMEDAHAFNDVTHVAEPPQQAAPMGFPMNCCTQDCDDMDSVAKPSLLPAQSIGFPGGGPQHGGLEAQRPGRPLPYGEPPMAAGRGFPVGGGLEQLPSGSLSSQAVY